MNDRLDTRFESDDYEDRVAGQFSRNRSQYGSMVVGGGLDSDDDAIPDALQTEGGRKGLNAVNVKVIGEQGDGDDGSNDPDPMEGFTKISALDAPLVHLAGAGELSDEEKLIIPVAMDKGL